MIPISPGASPHPKVGDRENQYYCIKHAMSTLLCKGWQTKPLSGREWRSIFRAFQLEKLSTTDPMLFARYPQGSPKKRAIYIQVYANPEEANTPVGIKYYLYPSTLFSFSFRFSQTCINSSSTLLEFPAVST